MEIYLRVAAQRDAEEIQSLAVALRESEAVDGEVDFVSRPLATDRLGGWTDAISVVVGASAALTALIREVAHFLMRRTTDLELEVSQGPDGTRVRLSAKRLRAMSADQLEDAIRQIGGAVGIGSQSGSEVDAVGDPAAPRRRSHDGQAEGAPKESS